MTNRQARALIVLGVTTVVLGLLALVGSVTAQPWDAVACPNRQIRLVADGCDP